MVEQREGDNKDNKGGNTPIVTQPHPSQQRIGQSVASESVFRVLVIDERTEDRASLRMALQAGGFVLEEATDAEHGLKLAKSFKPDCVVVGDVLPDASGREVLELLRQPDGTLPCAVVMLAEVGSANVVSAAMRAGALDYLVKDRLDANTLRRAIGSAVRHFRLIEAQRTAERRNAQFAAIVAASDNAIISTDADFVIRTWNAGAERLFGYSETEAREHTLTELVVPEAYEAENAALYAILINGRATRTETLRRHKDGHLVPVEINTSPILDQSGAVTGITIIYRDISERRRAEEARRALAESEVRFRATFQNAAVGISHFTADGKVLRFNEVMPRILGWSADELISKSFQEVTHPDDLAVELAQLEQLRDGKIDSYSLDKRYRRKDGTFVWTHRTVSCVRESDGSVDYFVSVLEDISARKCAEEQVQLLAREANHRVKNLLGLVQAIARQTADASSEAFVVRFAERIQALAASQDLLDRNQQRGADLEGLVHAQIAFFADLIGSRIAVGGPRLHLNAAAAQAIGLTLHELATNAGKYGALSTDEGRVDVSWQSEGDALIINWTESDGPPVQPPKRRGFGSTVIDSMAKLATGGEVQLDYATSGLVWRLRCPAANALEKPT
jgi:PAS domain S-box-containing protein